MVKRARSLTEAALRGVQGGGQNVGSSWVGKGVGLDASKVAFLLFCEVFVWRRVHCSLQAVVLRDFVVGQEGTDTPLLAEFLTSPECQISGMLVGSFVAGNIGMGGSPNNSYAVLWRMHKVEFEWRGVR